MLRIGRQRFCGCAQTAEIKTVPVCNYSIHCNTQHEARRRAGDTLMLRLSPGAPAPHRIRNTAQSSTHSHYRHLTHVSDTILLIFLPCSVTPTKLPTAATVAPNAPWAEVRPRLPGFRVRAHTHSLNSPSARIRLRHLGVARTLHKDECLHSYCSVVVSRSRYVAPCGLELLPFRFTVLTIKRSRSHQHMPDCDADSDKPVLCIGSLPDQSTSMFRRLSWMDGWA